MRWNNTPVKILPKGAGLDHDFKGALTDAGASARTQPGGNLQGDRLLLPLHGQLVSSLEAGPEPVIWVTATAWITLECKSPVCPYITMPPLYIYFPPDTSMPVSPSPSPHPLHIYHSYLLYYIYYYDGNRGKETLLSFTQDSGSGFTLTSGRLLVS